MDNDIRYSLRGQELSRCIIHILQKDGAARNLSKKQISQNIRYVLQQVDNPYKLVSYEQAQEILKSIPLPHTAPKPSIWQRLKHNLLNGLFLILLYTLYTVGSEIISFGVGYLYGRFAPQLVDTPLFYASIVAIAAITFYLCSKLAYYKKQLITFRIFYIFMLFGCVLRIILGSELPISEGLMFVAMLVIALTYESKFKSRKQNSLTAEYLQDVSSSKVNDILADTVVSHEISFADDSQSDCNFSKIDVTPAANTNMMPQETKTHHIAQSNNVNRFLILLSTLLCISLVGVLIWSIPLYTKLKEANASLDEAQAELTNTQTLYNTANSQKLKLNLELTDIKKELKDLKREHSSLQDRYYEIAKENFFYFSHACVVPLNDRRYHTLECVYDDLGEFHIYNIEYAEYIGLKPHSCIK